jgi:hypothetical protein
MNKEDGSFVTDDQGRPEELGSGVIVRWDEVLFAEVFPLEERVDD